MRISGIKKTVRGSVTVFMMISMTLIVTMLALLIDAGRITVARARLGAATDRAAYAGANALTYAMNSIAAENWKICKAWRDLKKDFAADSQMSVEAATQRHHRYEAQRDAAFDRIAAIQNAMFGHAREVSLGALTINAPYATGETLTTDSVPLRDDIDPEAQTDHPRYHRVTGQSFIDPVSTDSATFPALKYLIKPAGREGLIGVSSRQHIRPMLLGKFLPDGVEIEATAAAQSYGGSIEEFAKKETDSPEDAEAGVSDEGRDELYRAALVPMWTLGEAGEGYVH